MTTPIGVRGHGVERGVAGERHEVDLGELERLRLVEAGEGEQVFDEPAHADRLLLDALHRLGDLVVGLQGAHAVQLGVAAHRDERGAQLVRGVADEAAHLVDGACAVAERAIDAVEHGVERAVEPADLGVRRRSAEALAEVAVGDRGGGALDLAQRREGRGHEHAGEQRPDQDDAEAEAEEDREVGGEQALGVLRRDRDDDRHERAVASRPIMSAATARNVDAPSASGSGNVT